MLAHLAVVFAVFLQLQGAPPSGVVKGRVLSETTGAPLAYALVEVVSGDVGSVTMTDSAGGYELLDVPAGLAILRVQHLDHASLEVTVLVPPDRTVRLDMALALRPPVLARLHVRGETVHHGESGDTVPISAVDFGAAAARALESTPGMAELGLAEAARGTPAGHEPVDPSDVLYVRGAASDLKLVLLDGAPVYAPFHLGGLISPFDAGVLAAANLYVGGAPARYDGGLSYVMELETRRGRADRLRTAGAADLLSARGLVEGPIGGSVSYMAGLRTVHDLATLRFLDQGLPYGYSDGLVRLDFDLADDSNLGITGFWNHEEVSLDSVPDGPRDAIWGNAAAAVRWHVPFDLTHGEFTLALGRFEARLPVGGAQPLLVEGVARRARLNADFTRVEDDTELQYGVSFEQVGLRYRAWPRGSDPDSMVLDTREHGAVAGVYLDLGMRPARRIRIRTGIRADMYSLAEPARVSPRVEAQVLLSDRARLTLAGGRYSQYVRAPEPALVAPVSPAERDAAPPPPLTLASATHALLGLDQILADDLRLGLETYFKSYEDLPATAGAETRASGIDLWIRRDGAGLTGWLGYSLGWLWSSEDRRPSLDFFAGRHLVSLGLAGPVGPDGRFDVRFAYGAGLPFTAVPEPTLSTPGPVAGTGGPAAFRINGDIPANPRPPDAPYVRLDASISHAWRFDLMGVRREVVPYVKVINALDRRDGLFYRTSDNGDEPRVVAALPILPVLGVEWRF